MPGASTAACGAQDWTRALAVVDYELVVEPLLKTDRLSDMNGRR